MANNVFVLTEEQANELRCEDYTDEFEVITVWVNKNE